MMLPLQSLIAENYEFGLVVAVGIGFFFGFVLERAGFGQANKLAGQFYFHDMTVLKVMFGAIVTAMLGLSLAAGLGLVDFKAVAEQAASSTYLWPMLVGGLLLGVGFIVSGYCPGTSMVATASGNIDGALAFSGVIVGSVLYGEVQPWVADFHASGDMGPLFFFDLLGIPATVLAAGVALMAVGAFLGGEILERIFSKKRGKEAVPAPKRLAFATFGGLALAGLATLALPTDAPTEAPDRVLVTLKPDRLAERLLEEPWGIRVVDLRDRTACAKKRVPGSECAPLAELDKLGLPYAPGKKDLILVPLSEMKTLPDAAAAFPGKVLVLEGGFAAWRAFAYDKPAPLSAGATAEQRASYRFQAAFHQAMTGAKAAPPPPAPTQTFVPKKKRKGGGCS